MRNLKRRFNRRKFRALALIVFSMIPGPAYAADGDLDTTFGNGGKVTTDFSSPYDHAHAVAIQSDGKIVAAGHLNTGGFALARYTSEGSLDVAFGNGGKVTTKFEGLPVPGVTSLAIQSDGKILAAGQSYDRFDWYCGLLARYNSDGSLDSTFADGGKLISDFFTAAIAVQPDGKIVAGGGTLQWGLCAYSLQQRWFAGLDVWTKRRSHDRVHRLLLGRCDSLSNPG